MKSVFLFEKQRTAAAFGAVDHWRSHAVFHKVGDRKAAALGIDHRPTLQRLAIEQAAKTRFIRSRRLATSDGQ